MRHCGAQVLSRKYRAPLTGADEDVLTASTRQSYLVGFVSILSRAVGFPETKETAMLCRRFLQRC